MPRTALPQTDRRRHAVGFHLVAVVFAIALVFSTLPTPLYGLYQLRDHFAAPVITVVFAAYAVGVMAGLYFAGHISDWVGRRRVVLAGTVTELVSAVVFLVWPEVPGLIVARLLCGAGIGVLTATVTAHMGELRAVARPAEHPSRAALAATAVTMGGLALGPVVGGVLAEVLDAPLTGAFVPFVVLFALSLPLLPLIPETVDRPARPPAYRPQRVSVPARSRAAFLSAAAGVFVAFAVLGLFTSLAPTLMAGVFDEPSRVVGGLVAFAVLGAGAVAQVGLAGLDAAVRSRWGVAAMLAGLVLTPVSALLGVELLFWVGGVLGGAGSGLLFRSSVETVSGLAAPGAKAEVLAALFLAAYVGIALPVLGVGLVLVWLPAAVALVVFAVPMSGLVVWAARAGRRS
ncbi:major facilitator superfamily MFS_1 [Actinokineospora spheciospongiae]|uniref:Major facilitator superfamily MFS_1 n=1 Tax=Actinokineospora spheciospongiae TaxID=909613 RepID=W7IHP0_9PSEU|nr:MFS transporter [Actinokineospora spheciospongiae]EWC60430.1 major facilitator superfamily MFS_1 [Actinokineospora spheciospongiae]PWW66532.1 putative MFS family arabinose efflux permease [Actinokineospora spheciospongiae]